MARTSWIGAVLAVLLAEAGWSLVSAGPDHSPTPSCSDLYRSLSPEERHAARDSAQAVQALESYIGQARLGRPLPANSNATAPPTAPALEGWLAGNYSRLQQLLDGSGASQRLGGSGTAMTAAKACLSARLHPDGFAGRPVMSILLNYFKRPQIVNRISAAMRKACDAVNVTCEMVVNVDNPEEAGLWADQAGFVVPVFSANLHESRGYNRAAKLARGRYLIIWQDDQLPNEQGTWLLDMIKVFDAYPQLGILGMNTYRLCKHTEMTNRYGWTFWDPDPKTGVKWSFAQHVDFAPMAIRASIYHELGGLDEGISRPGDCGIWGDWELTNRAWMDGWQVGFMFSDGRGGDGLPGGTHLGSSAEKCWGRQQHVAMHVFHRRYGVEWVHDPMCGRVWLLNMLHHKLGYGTCPYGTKETRFGNCTVPMAADMERARQEMAQLEAAARVRGSGTYSAHVPLEQVAGLQLGAARKAIAVAGDKGAGRAGNAGGAGGAGSGVGVAGAGGAGGAAGVGGGVAGGGGIGGAQSAGGAGPGPGAGAGAGAGASGGVLPGDVSMDIAPRIVRDAQQQAGAVAGHRMRLRTRRRERQS